MAKYVLFIYIIWLRSGAAQWAKSIHSLQLLGKDIFTTLVFIPHPIPILMQCLFDQYLLAIDWNYVIMFSYFWFCYVWTHYCHRKLDLRQGCLQYWRKRSFSEFTLTYSLLYLWGCHRSLSIFAGCFSNDNRVVGLFENFFFDFIPSYLSILA